MKNIKNIIASGIVMLFIHNVALAQNPKTPAVKQPSSTPATNTAPTKLQLPAPVKVTSVEGITEYDFANGFKLLLFPDPSKATATVNITYLVGSRMEGYGETGMAHLLEHLMFKGSTGHPHIPQELTSHGASPNGTTWYDRTNYFETFSATEENLNWALSLESDRMINSFIDNKDLQSEFSVVRNEFESGENNPHRVLQERVLSTAYLWHNYGKSTIGSKEDIEKVPIENLKAFYKKYYQPDNAVLTIAGKFDEAKTLALVNQYFGGIAKPSRKLQEPYTVEPTQDGERFVELRRIGDIQVVSAAYHIPAASHPDFAALSILSDILTNEPSGRLYKALVETKKASSISGYASGLKDPGFVYYSAEILKDKSLSDARTAMMELFDKLGSAPATKEEVDRAKNKLLKNIELLFNNSDRVGTTMSEYISKGDWRLFFVMRDRLEKVTAEDVNRVAKAYFKASNRTVGLFIPEASPDRASIPANPNVDSLVKGYKGKVALADAETFDPSPANIDSRTKKGTIDGGAQYAFLSKSTRGGSVNVSITLRLGSEKSLEGKASVANYTAEMLNKGTAAKTRQQINDAFDKLKAQVSISGSGQTVNVGVTTNRENLAGTLKLITEILRQPSFPNDEFEKMRDEDLSNIDQNRSEPRSIASNFISRYANPYPKGHIKATLTFDEESAAVKGLKPDDIRKFYKDYYNGEHATVALVGDFDEAAALTELKAMLSNWTSTEKFERVEEKYFEVPAKVEKIKTPDKKNAVFVANQNLKLKDEDPDYPALTIGNFMLGGGFLNSRLATRIRQKEGLSYGVGSGLNANPIDHSGSFSSFAIYNPDNADKLVAAYKEEIERMLKDGFTEDELKDAKSGYLQQKQVGRSRDQALVGKLANNLYLNRKMEWDEKLEKKIEGMSAAEVNAAMKKYIQLDKISYVQAGDFK